MDNLTKKQIKTIETHIEALYSGYDKTIEILNKEMDTTTDDDGNVSVSLKDAQIKIYTEGLSKCAEAADNLLQRIQEKETQLDKLKNPDKKEVKKQDENPLSKRLK
jgi:hypothetical protein